MRNAAASRKIRMSLSEPRAAFAKCHHERGTMLRKLFNRKPRLDAPEPAARIAAVAALPNEAQDDFERLALNDADAAVRAAALGRLTRLQPLTAALDDEALADEAAKRLLTLMDEHTPDAVRHHSSVLRAAVVCADTAAAAAAAAANIEDAAQRAAAILAHPHAGVRLAVAETIWQPAVLAALEKGARGTDSATHRLARERGGLYRSASTEREAEDAHVDELLAAATALNEADAHYEARYTALERKWRDALTAVATTDGKLAAFGVVARDVEAMRLRFPTRHVPPSAPHVSAQAWADLLAQAEALPATIADVATSADAAGAADCMETLARRVDDTKRQATELAAKWNAMADVQRPDDALRERFHAIEAAVVAHARRFERAAALRDEAAKALQANSLDVTNVESAADHKRELVRRRAAVARLLARYDWPEDVPVPAQLTALRERHDALNDAVARCDAETAEVAEEVASQLAELRRCVEAGEAREAAQLDQRLRNLARRLPPREARAFSADLAEVGTAVRELREWRLYAEAPKREALCREMEALVENPRPVNAQTEAVRDVRQRWNALGRADMGRTRALTKRFEAAAEQAFAPCRTHFKEQAERRAFNLQQRRAIVSALEDFLANNDWEHADWRGVEQVLRQAHNEWRAYHPVDRKAERDVKPRFEELTGRIRGLLKEAWARHVQMKEEIVAEALQVRESGDQASAKADAMKALQRRWTRVGPVPRAADQRLWKRFRAECDAVFEARSAAMGRHLERRAAIDEAEALISELNRRVDLDAALDRNAVADYQQRLEALGSLPKELQRRAETTIADADRTVVENQRGR